MRREGDSRSPLLLLLTAVAAAVIAATEAGDMAPLGLLRFRGASPEAGEEVELFSNPDELLDEDLLDLGVDDGEVEDVFAEDEVE